MGKFNDITGQKFGKLTVVKLTDEKTSNGERKWLCRCECGNEVVVRGTNLRSGHTKTCGCAYSDNKVTHGKSRSRIYRVWNGMKNRCNNPKYPQYRYYGGRGISCCEEWNKFENFYKWALESGYNETAKFGECTIDRIDVDGNYEPNNCRWVDAKTQQNNKQKGKITIKAST